MANKPTIYGFDDAGCKWETEHKENIASAINSAKTELNGNINSVKTELNGNINSAKTELNGNINSVLPNKVFACVRNYNASKELDLYNICTFNVGEMGIYSLGTSSGSIKLTVSNANMGVRFLALGFDSNGALKQSICQAFSKASAGTTSLTISDGSVQNIYVIAVRTA